MDSDPPKEIADADPTGEVHSDDPASAEPTPAQNISRELAEMAESLDPTRGDADEPLDKKNTDDGDLLLDEGAIEALLNAEQKIQAPPEDPRAEDPPTEDALSPEGMDDRLDAPEGKSDYHGDNQGDDQGDDPQAAEEHTLAPEAEDLVPAKDSEPDAISQDLLDEIMKEADEAEEKPTEEDPKEPPVAEEVGSENIAAGATKGAEDELLSQDLLDKLLQEADDAEEDQTDEAIAEAPPESAEETPPAAETPEPASEAETTSEADSSPPEDAPSTKSKSSPVAKIITFVRTHPARIAATLVAGLTFGLVALVVMTTNQLRDVAPGENVARGEGQLERAMDYARALLDSGESRKAVSVLETALDRAPQTNQASTASFLLIQARLESLPDTVSDARADPIHEEIDHLVERSQGHPQVPEALYWKAQLYKAAGNPIAARGVLQRLMREHADAERIDRVYFEAGQLELENGRPEQAAEHFESLLAGTPASTLATDAALLRGDALAMIGREDEAQRIYRRAAQTSSDPRASAKAFERLGKLALDAGRYGEAIEVLETRLETATSIEGNDAIYLLLAEALRKAGNLEQARTLLNELIEFFPESDAIPSAYVDLSQVLRDLGRGSDGLRFATQAVQRYPDNPEVLRNEGEMLAESGDAQAAGRALIAADRAGGEDPELLLAAGHQFAQSADWERARDTYTRVASRFPDAPQAIEGAIGAARALYESGQIGPALAEAEALAEATQGRQSQLRVLVALGELYRDLGLKAAVADIYSRIASSTTEPRVLADAAVALLAADAWDEGLAVANRTDLDGLTSTSAYDLLLTQGEILMRVDSDKALQKMEQAYEAYPEERTSKGDQLYLRANLAAGRTARARVIVEDLQRRVDKHEIDPERLNAAAVTWGDFLFERSDFRAASDAYRKALQSAHLSKEDSGKSVEPLSETQHWALYQRANALLKMTRYADSIELYDQLDAINSPWSSEAKSRASAARLELRLRGGAGSRQST